MDKNEGKNESSRKAEEAMDRLGGAEDHPYQIGKNYFIRTLTHYYTGKLIRVLPKELVLIDAAWIASDQRFADCIAKGAVEEVEPFPDGREVIVPREGSNACVIDWPLPRNQQ